MRKVTEISVDDALAEKVAERQLARRDGDLDRIRQLSADINQLLDAKILARAVPMIQR